MQTALTPEQRQQAIQERLWLLTEQKKYPYLPAASWMVGGHYTLKEVGTYLHTAVNGTVHRLTMLSQTSMLLVFRDGAFLGAGKVRNDDDFLRFLTKHAFPLPV